MTLPPSLADRIDELQTKLDVGSAVLYSVGQACERQATTLSERELDVEGWKGRVALAEAAIESGRGRKDRDGLGCWIKSSAGNQLVEGKLVWEMTRVQPFRLLEMPTEVISIILKFCSESDLASFCRVSFLCLKLGAAILYGHVEMTWDTMQKMLTKRKPEWIGSRVAGELSLRSTHSISIVHLNESPGQDAVLLSTDRLGTHGWEGVKQLEFQFQDVSQSLYVLGPLLGRLNPQRVTLRGGIKDGRSPSTIDVEPRILLDYFEQWTRLEQITFSGRSVIRKGGKKVRDGGVEESVGLVPVRGAGKRYLLEMRTRNGRGMLVGRERLEERELVRAMEQKRRECSLEDPFEVEMWVGVT